MNILITGANGFLAKEIQDYYSESKEVNLIPTDRTTLNPTDFNNVHKFFDKNKIDIVIHTAVRGGKRNQEPQIEDVFDNISMFQNLAYFSDKFKMMFNFGSGAEFDRKFSIEDARELDIHQSLPEDYYGLAKNIITRKIVKLSGNIYNLRLFGCFGVHEEPQRLFRSCYENLRLNEPAVILDDKRMDYFYAQDVGRVIDFFINNDESTLPHDINLCYSKKYTLSEHAKRIKYLTKSQQQVIINNKELRLSKSYTGDATTLSSLNINLTGLEKGVSECLKSWSKS